MTDNIRINRAPVLTLWAAVVAERLGYDHDAALTLGRSLAGLNAYSKGKSLGIFEEPAHSEERAKPKAAAEDRVTLLGRPVPVIETPAGLRAVAKGEPISPASVERYLNGKFRDRLAEVRSAMAELAASLDRDTLDYRAYELYEAFRPTIPAGARGWGAYGELDLARLAALAQKGR